MFSPLEDIDPVGSCVGQKGVRVQSVVNELGGEKIDIIKWSEDPAEFISNALSPSKVERVDVKEEEKSALVVVPDYQLSLAIGKEGQNARLAAKLTGWKIDIKSETQYEEYLEMLENPPAEPETTETEAVEVEVEDVTEDMETTDLPENLEDEILE